MRIDLVDLSKSEKPFHQPNAKKFSDLLSIKSSKDFLSGFIELSKGIKVQKIPEFWLERLFNRVDEILEEANKAYRQLLREKPSDDEESSKKIIEIEEQYSLFFKLSAEQSNYSTSNVKFQSMDRLIELLHLSHNFEIIAQNLHLMAMLLAHDNTIIDTGLLETYPQLLTDIPYLCLHINLYNNEQWNLSDLFHDDIKYAESEPQLSANRTTKVTKTYKPSINFEFFLQNAANEGNEKKIGRFSIQIEDLTEKYKGMTNPYLITKKVVEEYALPIKEGDKMFSALFHRVRLALGLPNYQTRLAITKSVIFAQASHCALKKILKVEANLARFDDFMLFKKEYDVQISQALELLHLQLTPQLHTAVIEFFRLLVKSDQLYATKPIFVNEMNQNATLFRTFKDSTSIFVDNEGKIQAKSLILSPETVLKSKFCLEFLKLIHHLIKNFFTDERKGLSPDIVSITSVVAPILSVVKSHEDTQLFCQEVVEEALKIVKSLTSDKDIMREHNIIETLIEACEHHFRNLEEQRKIYLLDDKGEKVLMEEQKYVQTVYSVIDSLSAPFIRYFVPRVEMAPTLARKIAESKVINLGKSLIEKGFASQPDCRLFLSIMKLISDLAGESPSLISRFIENGIYESILKEIQKGLPQHEFAYEIFGFLSSFCLNGKSMEIERKYQIVEKVFEYFSEPENELVVDKWFSANEEFSSKFGARSWVGSFLMSRETCQIYKNATQYRDIIVEKLIAVAEKLNGQHAKNVSRIAALQDLYPAIEKDAAKKKEYEQVQKEFLFYYKAVNNFTTYISKVFKEHSRIRKALFEKGILNAFQRLVGQQRLFYSDFGGNDAWVNPCIRAISYEIESSELALLTELGKYLTESINGIEEAIGAKYAEVKDLSGVISDELALAIGEKGLFQAIVTTSSSKDNLKRILELFYNISMLHGLLIIFHEAKPDYLKDMDKFAAILRILLGQAARERIKIVKQLAAGKLDAKASEQKSLLDELKREFSNERQSFNNFLEIDELFNVILSTATSLKNFTNDAIPSPVYSQLANSLLKNVHHGPLPEGRDEQLETLVNNYFYFDAVFRMCPNSGKLLENFRHPVFVLDFYQQGGAETLLGCLKNTLTFFEQGRHLPYENDETVRGYLAKTAYNQLLNSLQFALDKMLFNPIDYKYPTLLNGKKVKGQELCEYSNFIWINQIQMLWFTLNSLEKLPQLIFSEDKKEEKKEGKPEDKPEDKKEESKKEDAALNTKKNLQKISNKCLELILKALTKPQHGEKVDKEIKKPVTDVHEKVVKDLMDMGVSKEVAKYAVLKAPHPNVGAALDWIMDHPDIEATLAAKPKENKESPAADLGSDLQTNNISKLSSEDFKKELMKVLEGMDHAFLKSIFSYYDNYEEVTTKITLASIKLHENCGVKSYPHEFSLIIAKIFRQYLNEYFKNLKFISSFKVSKSFDKEIGADIIKSLKMSRNGLLEKLKGLDTLYLWFSQTYRYLPNFEANIIKSDFLIETLGFFEHLLTNLDELEILPEEDKKKAIATLRNVIQKHIKISHKIIACRGPEPKKTEESKKAMEDKDNSRDVNVSKEEEKKKGDSPARSKKSSKYKASKKTVFEYMISLLQHSNKAINKYKEQIVFNLKSLATYLEILSIMVKESTENIKLVLQKKIVSELMKIRLNESLSEDVVSQIGRIMMEMILYAVEDPLIKAYTIENEIKHLFEGLKQANPDAPAEMSLAKFVNSTKELHTYNQKIYNDVVNLLCITTRPKKEKPSTEKKGKRKASVEKEKPKDESTNMISSIMQKFKTLSKEESKQESNKKSSKPEVDKARLTETMIKLRPDIDLSKYHCVSLFKSRSKITLESNTKERSEAPQPQALEISPLVNMALSSIIDIIVISLIDELEHPPESEKSGLFEFEPIFDFTDLINTLLILANSYPVLIPFIVNYDLSKHFNDRTFTRATILNEYKQRKSGYDFLSFYTVVLNYISVGTLEHFLMGLLYCKNPFTLNELGEPVTYDNFIRQRVISELKHVLESQTQQAVLFDEIHSARKLCAVSCLMIPLIAQTKNLSIILAKPSKKDDSSFLELYAELMKKFDITRYYKIERLLPFIFKPFSILLQYSNYIIKNGVDLSKIKALPQNLLYDEKGHALNWETLTKSLPDVNQYGRPGYDQHAFLQPDMLRPNRFTVQMRGGRDPGEPFDPFSHGRRPWDVPMDPRHRLVEDDASSDSEIGLHNPFHRAMHLLPQANDDDDDGLDIVQNDDEEILEPLDALDDEEEGDIEIDNPEEEENASDEEANGEEEEEDEGEESELIPQEDQYNYESLGEEAHLDESQPRARMSQIQERQSHSDALLNKMAQVLSENGIKDSQLQAVFTELSGRAGRIGQAFSEETDKKKSSIESKIFTRIKFKLHMLRNGSSGRLSASGLDKSRARDANTFLGSLERQMGQDEFRAIARLGREYGYIPPNLQQHAQRLARRAEEEQAARNREELQVLDAEIGNELLNILEREGGGENEEIEAEEQPEDENLFEEVEEESKGEPSQQQQSGAQQSEVEKLANLVSSVFNLQQQQPNSTTSTQPTQSQPQQQGESQEQPQTQAQGQAQEQPQAQSQQQQQPQQQPEQVQQSQSQAQVEQSQPQSNPVDQSNQNAGQENLSGGIRFEDFGLTADFLTAQGIDPNIFEFLDEEGKLELIMPFVSQPFQSQGGRLLGVGSNNQPSGQQSQPQQNQPGSQQQAQPQQQAKPGDQSGAQNQQPGEGQPQQQPGEGQAQAQPNPENNLDVNTQEFLESLPEDIRQELIQQQQQLLMGAANPYDFGNLNQGEMDPATSLATLAPELRQEILMTAGPQLLDQLPAEIAAEAEMLRDRTMNNRFDYNNPEGDEFDDEPQANVYIGGGSRARPNAQQSTESEFFKMMKKIAMSAKGTSSQKPKKELADQYFKAADKLIETLLSLLYLEHEAFGKFPASILRALCEHPENEFKVLETLMFLLKSTEVDFQKEGLIKADESDETKFPPQVIFEKTRLVRKKDLVNQAVSTKALYLISVICSLQSEFFFGDIAEEEEKGIEEQMMSKMPDLSIKKSESLSSIRHYKDLMAISLEHPISELLKLCRNHLITKDTVNIELLIMILESITRNPLMFRIVKEEPEETKEGEKSKKAAEPKVKEIVCRVKLSLESVKAICSLLSCHTLSEGYINNLSKIILIFCQEKENLDKFINELKNLIFDISKNTNKVLEDKKDFLKQLSSKQRKLSGEGSDITIAASLYKSIQQLDHEYVFLRISKIIKKLYETSIDEMKRRLALQKKNEAAKKAEEKKAGEKKNEEGTDKEEKKPEAAEKKKEEEEEEKKDPKAKEEENQVTQAKEGIVSSLNNIIKDENLTKLWINLTELLNLTQDYFPNDADINNALSVRLRPIIESFFIIHKILHEEAGEKSDKQDKNLRKVSISQLVDEIAEQPTLGKSYSAIKKYKFEPDDMFHFMCDRNKRVLNAMVKHNPELLNDALSIIAQKLPKIFDFEIRRTYFRNELAKLKRNGGIKIRVKRARIFDDSYAMLNPRPIEDWKRKIAIEFAGEEGVDAGGVSREWFLELSRAMFNPQYALFIPNTSGNTFQPNPKSSIHNYHLTYFKFVGKFIAKALFEGQLLECYFTPSFYKHILGQPLSIHDMEDIDTSFYKSLVWMLGNDITDAGLEETFSYTRDYFGKTEIVDLVEDGRNKLVTEENKQEYVKQICYAKMAKDIKYQIEHFLEGFFELVPKHLVQVFDARELELLISGLPDVDIVDMRENTEYHGYDPNNPIIKAFWEIMEEMNQTQRAAFLQFVTGTSKVPLDGFKALKGMHGPQRFQIHKTTDIYKLPTTHTCFNQLDLPEYPTKEMLKEKLLLAISYGKEGFGFM